MNLAIVGSRIFNNYEKFCEIVDNYINENGKPEFIISGGADGIDFFAELYADKYNIEKKIYEAFWDEFGDAAGPIRNTKIINHCTHVLAMPIKASRGTNDTIKKAKIKKKIMTILYVDDHLLRDENNKIIKFNRDDYN
jgi:hypothetical protein